MKRFLWVSSHVEELLLTSLLSVVVLISGIQVVARYTFNNSLVWSEELCRYLFIWSGFITIAYCIKRGSIIKIDTLLLFLPHWVKKTLDILATLLCGAVFAILLQNAILIVQKAMASGQVSPALKLPMYILYIGPVIGFLLVLVRLIQHLIRLFLSHKDTGTKEEKPCQ